MLFKQVWRASIVSARWLVFALCFIEGAYSQTFSSGSTGADGALNITAPGVTYFNPKVLNLNPAIPNIFNFTTITIAAGSTLKLTEKAFHGPAFFLASGAVVISGTLDLGGDNAITFPSGLQGDRLASYGGSGGYGGGLGGAPTLGLAPEAGNGPGGGGPAINTNTPSSSGRPGQFTGNSFLIPLIGGSGGGGSLGGTAPCIGDSGAGGGGAILIASSASITINGTITAAGGQDSNGFCDYGGSGSGGAIRLMASVIGGTGSITASGGSAGPSYGDNIGGGNFQGPGGTGEIRLEAFTQSFSGSTAGTVVQSVPFNLALPATGPGSLAVTSVNGITINANPFSFPDAVINASGPVTVNIQAQYIPPGTIPQLIVFSSAGPDLTITCSPLAGTLQSSTSTATVTFPGNAGSRGFVKATWTQ